MREMLLKHIRLLRAWRNKTEGFTLVEVLLAAVILSVIIGVSVYAMNAAHISFNLTLASKSLQSEVRSTVGWIVKDARQAVSWDLANNNPTPSYIKFRQVTGWDTANNTFSLSNYYIEYTYNFVDHTIIRRTSDLSDNTIGVWTLNNVNNLPFSTLNSSGDIVPLNNSDLLTSKRLIVTVSGLSSEPDLQDGYSLTEEVQIRNG
ncbi:MAG: hypothetical protein COV73_01020 [Candidatus Omnitrophica bacterium CG11_big_fil_rev_8_21_14_0_20_43_6]|nr:MAG: hypothetical protein COV73_01020 [Candidatus Omnitrophica bacterium CG11_big_fil_rev_8_21_14_0_20_43_6]